MSARRSGCRRRTVLAGLLGALAARADTRDLFIAVPAGRVPGWLTVPQDRPAPWPAVVLLPDVFGMDDRTGFHAERLLHEGLAVLVPHVWIARGLEQDDVAETDDPATLLPDLQAALAALGGLTDIDPHRLGVLGLGLGGATAMLAWAQGMPGLAATAALYPTCPDLPVPADARPLAPLLVAAAEHDPWGDPSACRSFARAAGGSFRMTTYRDARYAFDTPPTSYPVTRVLRRADGRATVVRTDPVIAEDARGRAAWFLAETLGSTRWATR